MKLDVRATMITGGVLWGLLAMFGVGAANLIWPDYGGAFLNAMASIYPGYHAEPTFGQVLIGGGYGIVDGAVGGAILAGLYNLFTPHRSPVQ